MTNIPEDTYESESKTEDGKARILIVTANDVQDLEFFYPYYRFIEEGYSVDVATPDGGELKAMHGETLQATQALGDIDPEDYDLLVIPGGKAPAKLKKDEEALGLTRDFVVSGKPIAAICHGAQLLAAADVIRGKRVTAWPEVEDEVLAAGGVFVNEETVTDGQFITARWPGDLPAFMRETLNVLEAAEIDDDIALQGVDTVIEKRFDAGY